MDGIFALKMNADNMKIIKNKKLINMSDGIYFLTIMTLLLFSCTGRNSNKYSYKYGEVSDSITSRINNDTTLISDDFKYIDIKCTSAIQSANGLIHDLELLALETNEMSLIGNIDKIILKDSMVYLLDINHTKSLKVFNFTNGKFIQKIGAFGKSNSEYIEPTDFVVTDDHVIILDNVSKKMLVYDLKNNFIETIRLKYSLQSLNIIEKDSTLIGVAGDNRHINAINKYKILGINFNGTIKSKYLRSDYDLNYSELNNLKIVDTNVWYHSSFSSDIICIENSTAKVKYKLRFNLKMLPNDFVKDCDNDFGNFIDKYRNKYSYLSGECCYTKRYFFSRYVNQGRFGSLFIYDKRDETIIYNGVPSYDSKNGKIEDFVMMRLGATSTFVSSDDYIYGIIPSEILSIFNDSKQIKNMIKRDTIIATDNPILFKMRFDPSLNL